MSASQRPSAEAILHALQCGKRGCPCAASFRRRHGATHCPVHHDAHPSFSVGEKDETVLVHCLAGCPQDDVIAALRERGLWSARRTGGTGGRRARTGGMVTRWTWVSADGEVLASHCRRDRPDGSKAMWWETADGETSHGAIHPSDLPLYRVPDVLHAPRDAWIVFGEGEKAAESGRALGFVSTTLAGGASQRDFGDALTALAGRRVALVPDNDATGRGLMRAVYDALMDLDADVRWVELPGVPPKGDLADFLAAGHTTHDLGELIAQAPSVPPPGPEDHDAHAGTDEEGVGDAESDSEEDEAVSQKDALSEESVAVIPPLPTYAVLPETMVRAGVCTRAIWLDPFIAAAGRASPRSPQSLLEACGLFLLMLAIARRCYVRTGAKQVFAALYLLFIGRSTTRAKTTALEVLRHFLGAAGLTDLLLPGRFTAQALAMDLALWMQPGVRDGSPEVQERWLERHRHGAARGIVRDEASGLFDDCTKDYNSGLLPFLLELDGAPASVDPPLTISRGEFRIENACLTLLGATTPAALRLYVAEGQHWRNGLFGRFALIAADEEPRWAFWSQEEFPPEITQGLKRVYDAFPRPYVRFTYAETETTAKGEPKPPRIVGAEQAGYVAIPAGFCRQAWEMYAAYDRALFELAGRPQHPERMDPTYGRLPGLAVRVALTLACCEWALARGEGGHMRQSGPEIGVGHWAAAQAITERWRADAHRILAAALAEDAQEAGAADVAQLINLLRAGPQRRGDVLQSLKWTADRLTLAVTGSGGRIVEDRRATAGRPARWLSLADDRDAPGAQGASSDYHSEEDGIVGDARGDGYEEGEL